MQLLLLAYLTRREGRCKIQGDDGGSDTSGIQTEGDAGGAYSSSDAALRDGSPRRHLIRTPFGAADDDAIAALGEQLASGAKSGGGRLGSVAHASLRLGAAAVRNEQRMPGGVVAAEPAM
nr:unnamed protein product [Digitaria exilis]